jgi:polyhydroxyalkanoate synthesis regulator phasin
MPSKDLRCEFCDKEFRKNELARHVKAKHVVELGKHLLQEYIENPSTNSLQRYAKGLNPKNNPVYSNVYADACYYFGATPMFFEECDSYGVYIKSEENMKIHNDFLVECIKTISMFDYINAEREIEIRSDKVRNIEREKNDIQQKNKELETLNASNAKRIQYLQSVIDEFKEATECSTTIPSMKEEIKNLQIAVDTYKREADTYRQRYVNLEDNIENIKTKMYEECLSKQKHCNDQADILFNQNQVYKKESDELKTKFEAKVSARVSKETEKMKEQYDKDMKKMKDKLEKEHEKEIDEKDEEIDDLKKQIKKLKKSSKKITIESDSE